MKLISTLLFLLCLGSINNILVAQSVNINMAKTIAEHHLASISKSTLKSAGSKGKVFRFTSIKSVVENKDTLYYILNDTINKGFVIVSADNRVWPILAYSLEDCITGRKEPEAFTAWMENRKKEIAYIKQNNLLPDSATKASWQNLSLKSSAIETSSVEPLLKTKWNQDCFYNGRCPEDTGGPCSHVLTGCVATSIAQIMKYWNYPTTGTGSHSYLSSGYGILSADFGSTTYQWSQMPDVVASQNDAVAMLMYHCGVALEMKYSSGNSGAYNPVNELIKYFNYSSEAEVVDKRFYSKEDWGNLLKSELDLGRPIYYHGTKNSCDGGHAFVCDGYQNSDYFHFNWGWGGSFDGYFYLESLNPGGESYTFIQDAIIKLFPASLPDGYGGLMLSDKTIGIGNGGGKARVTLNSSSDWTVSSNQSWLTINSTSGIKGSTIIIFNALANPDSGNRKAIVTVSGIGFENKTIEVTQFGKFEVKAGNLKTVLANQLSTITNLTISGTIDARDFRTMRDEMPALSEIDLSKVTITAYSGTEGTIFQNYTYPANAVPDFAFLLPVTNLAKTRLRSIVLPPTLASIENNAFSYCKNLTLESIPSGVTFIGDNVFGECNGSETFVLPPNLNHIGTFAFHNFKGSINVDSKNLNFSSLDGVLFNKDGTLLIQCPISKSGTYAIPSSVTSIGSSAFDCCKNLISISIPSSVNNIENYAFNDCKGLTSIIIPSSVTSIGQRAFGGFNGSISVDVNNQKFSASDGVLFNKAQTELIQCPVSKAGNYTIPSTVTVVKEEAFHSCKNISSISIPASVRSIGSFAFYCVGLSSIYNHCVTPVKIEATTFPFVDVNKASCILHVPFGTKAIYAAANTWKDFENIVEMPGIFLSAKTIGIGIYGGTTQTSISSNVAWTATSDQQWLTVSPINGSAGVNTITLSAATNPTASTRKATITISAEGLVSQTMEITQYGIFETTAGNMGSILGNQISTMTSLTLTGTIDARDFKTMRDEMPELREIDLSRVTIAEYTGSEGTADTSKVYYPANSIPCRAFDKSRDGIGNTVIKSIIMPSSVTAIGNYAFSYCLGITSFSIPTSVTSIGLGAFYRCSGFKNINIPSSVSEIGDLAFYDFNGSINVDANSPNFSAIDGVLYNKNQTELVQCPASKSGNFIVPASVKAIHVQAFTFCDELTSIVLPQGLTTIEEGAFSYCSGLELINIPSSVVAIGQSAFFYCKNLSTFRIPASVNSIGSWAFMGCSSLDAIYAHPVYPVNLSNSPEVFVNFVCTLYVSYGSKVRYQSAPQWKNFTNIVENKLPVANGGPDQVVNEKSLVTLNGSNSFDSEKEELTYKWTAPSGITLSSNSVAKPTFIVPDVKEDTKYIFSLTVNDGWDNSNTDQVVVTVKDTDNAPYVKNPISNIFVDKRAPDQVIDLKTVFADDDLGDVLNYSVTVNTNNQVVSTKIAGSNLIVSFSTQNFGLSEIEITANSNGKAVISRFKVEVKIPTGVDPLGRNQKLTVFPNPTNGKIKVVFGEIPQSGTELTVTNITGKAILKQVVQESEAWIDLSGNAPGIYFIKTDQKNVKAQKLILE